MDLHNYLNAVDDPGSSKISPSCIVKVDIPEVINVNITVGLIEVILSTTQGIAKILGKNISTYTLQFMIIKFVCNFFD